MATKRGLDNEEIETQLICDSDSDCYTEYEEGNAYDKGCEDENDEEFTRSSSPPLSS
jgi:hypothetical protein